MKGDENMLRDITIGQYYPENSIIHKLDPRTKLAATAIYIISLFTFKSIVGYLVAGLFLLGVIKLSKVPFSYIVKGLNLLSRPCYCNAIQKFKEIKIQSFK